MKKIAATIVGTIVIVIACLIYISTNVEGYTDISPYDLEKIVDKEKTVLVPKIENLLDVYNFLPTAEDKNDLLKNIITQVTYLKTEKAIKKNSDPTNFSINLYPKINKAM